MNLNYSKHKMWKSLAISRPEDPGSSSCNTNTRLKFHPWPQQWLSGLCRRVMWLSWTVRGSAIKNLIKPMEIWVHTQRSHDKSIRYYCLYFTQCLRQHLSAIPTTPVCLHHYLCKNEELCPAAAARAPDDLYNLRSIQRLFLLSSAVKHLSFPAELRGKSHMQHIVSTDILHCSGSIQADTFAWTNTPNGSSSPM